MLAARVLVVREILRATPRGEIRVGARAVRPQRGRREPLLETPQRVEVVADAPEQQIGVGARTDERVCVHTRGRARGGVDEFGLL